MEIVRHFSGCNAEFLQMLTERVDVNEYSKKIYENAVRFEAWGTGKLVGLVAAYCNDHSNRIAFITNVSVFDEWKGHGIASQLISQCVDYIKKSGMFYISLEVASVNAPAIRLYKKIGFVATGSDGLYDRMLLTFDMREAACQKNETTMPKS